MPTTRTIIGTRADGSKPKKTGAPKTNAAANSSASSGPAESIGLNATDNKCLDILVREGPMPAGRLAEITGLTTGAITAIIGRLEKAGFAQRAKDPDDRRKVIVAPVEEEAMRRLGPIFAALRQDVEDFHARYSNEELALVLDYMNRCIGLMRDRTRRLQDGLNAEPP